MRTGENIYKRKDGRWEARYIYEYDANGKAKYRSVYGISRQAAKQKRISLVHEFIKGSAGDASSIVIIFKDLAKKWLDNTKLRVKKSTYARYFSQVQNHVLPHFGKYQVSKISTEFIEQFVACLMKTKMNGGFGLSPKTVEDILIIIKSVFRFGKCHTHLELNRIKIKKENKRPTTLSKTKKTVLNKYLLTDTDNCKAGVLLSTHTGIRLGEVCALRWKDFDLEMGTVHVDKTMQLVLSQEKRQNKMRK